MEEIWKKINSLYEVSNMGNVRNTKTGLILSKNRTNGNGYINVCLHKKNYYVHRLVAEKFVEGYSKNLVVNHKDGNRANNIYTNLEWVTQKENITHALVELKVTMGTNWTEEQKKHLSKMNKDKRLGKENHKSKPVRNINTGEVFESAGRAAVSLGLSNKKSSAIGEVCNGNKKTYKGYKWEWVND